MKSPTEPPTESCTTMSHQNPTAITPDFEERHRLALAVLEHLGIDPTHIVTQSLIVQFRHDGGHLVTWAGTARITTEELDGILTRVRTPRHPEPGICDGCGALLAGPPMLSCPVTQDHDG